MRPPDPILIFIWRLNKLNVTYMVTGSTACIVYGQPRLTNDVDIVLELDRPRMGELTDAFPVSEFYCPPEEVLALEAARALRGHFNIIHYKSGLKADCYLMGRDPLHSWGMSKRRRIEISGGPVWLAPPEYVIIRKLEYFREGGSDKHLQDIRGILEVSGDIIDRKMLNEHITERKLADVWRKAGAPDLFSAV